MSTRGISALEIVITVGLSIILLSALLRFLVAGFPIARITILQTNSTETARTQLRRISDSLRQIRYSDTGAYPLLEMLPQRMIFYANVDGDPAVERVRYELDGTNLERGVVNPSGVPIVYDADSEEVSIVARSIQNGSDPIFSYFNGDYPEDTTPLTPADVTDVKYVQFNLVIDSDPAQDPEAVTVQSQVQLRNLKTNLGQTTASE